MLNPFMEMEMLSLTVFLILLVLMEQILQMLLLAYKVNVRVKEEVEEVDHAEREADFGVKL
jgi:hypothetical protein